MTRQKGQRFEGSGGLPGSGNRNLSLNGNVVAMVLAGGEGERLRPLTESRAKAAVPFGGFCRLIDFVLSNLVNSGIRETRVITQHNAPSVLSHLEENWNAAGDTDGWSVIGVPPPAGGRSGGYFGTADAVLQNLRLLAGERPELVLVFSSDQVYAMDVSQMIAAHLAKRADVTVATIPRPVTQCHQFSTVNVSAGWRVRGFDEETPEATAFQGHPDYALVSMDNYVFNFDVLLEELEAEAADGDGRHDLVRDVLPRICRRRSVYAYDYRSHTIPGAAGPTDYWRDVGTIQSYFRATMDLNNPLSHLPLFGQSWPLMGRPSGHLPAKIVCNLSGRSGCVENSVLGSASVVVGAYVRDSVIGPNVRILSHAVVEESVILGHAVIGEGAKVKRSIVDEGNVIAEGERIGFDRELDASRYFVDKTGLVVVPAPGSARKIRSGEPLREVHRPPAELRM